MATPKEVGHRTESVAPILNTLIEAIKNTTNETDRNTQVKNAVETTKRITPNQEDIEISQAQLDTKSIENSGVWIGHNTDFIDRYGYKKSADSVVQLEQSKAMLKAVFPVGNPDWLISNPDSIQHCAEAAEFISRVSLLPERLRENPYVLYKETMKFSASLEWSSMTIEAQKEAHRVLDNAMRKYLELRYKNEISTEFGIADNMLRSLTQSSVETEKTPIFYVENEEVKKIPKGAGVSKTLHEQLTELQKQVQMDSPLDRDQVQLAKTLENLKRDYGQDNVALYVAKFRRLQQVAQEAREEGREKSFSTISLRENAMDELLKGGRDAEWAIEEHLQLIEMATKKFPSGPIGQALHHKIELMAAYFSDHQYKEDLLEYAAKKFPKNQAAQKEFVDNATGQILELQEKIESRMAALVTYGHIKLTGDPKKVSESLLNLGTRGVNKILSENGGINEQVYNRYINLMKLGRFNKDTHKLEPYTGETLFELRRRIKEEIKADIDLYDGQYQSYWEGRHTLKDNDNAIDSIIRQTEVVVAITQQDIVAILQAPGPAERGRKPGDFLGSSSFLSMNTTERFLSAMNVDAYAFEKWGKLTDYPKYMWRRMCEMAAKGSEHHEAAIAKRLNGIQQGDNDNFIALVKEVFGSKDNMKAILSLEHKANPKFIRSLDHSPEEYNQVTMKELEQEMRVQEGKKIVTGMLEAYDNFSSGWRIKQYLIQLNRMYGIEAPDGQEEAKQYLYGPHHLGLGMQLRLAGYDLIHAESETKRHEYKDTVQKILKNEIAQYRPQAIIEFLYSNKDTDAMAKFQSMVSGGKLTKARLGEGVQEDITHIDQFYHFINRRFIAINDALADKGLPPINYAIGVTAEQMTVVEKVCAVTKINAAAYLDVMKEATVFSGNQDNLNKLTETRYDHIYSRTQWVDDLRTRYLENPDTAPGSRTKEKYEASGKTTRNIRLSETFVEDGSGGGDQLPRSWNDMNTALEALNELTACLTHDKKQFFEHIPKIYELVGQYSGYKPAAARASIYLLAGFGESAATDEELNLFMLNGADNSSVAKRLVGDKGLSLSPGELLEITEEFEGLLKSKLHGLAPHLAEEAEKYIGTRWKWAPEWIGEVGHHLPAWGDRAKIALILIGLLIISQAAKEAQKELSGGQTSGGKSH